MPSVVLTGGRSRRSSSKKVRIPKLPRARGKRRSAPVIVPSTATASASERAALQSLASRLQRGDVTAWRSASFAPGSASTEAAKAAALTGAPAAATDLVTGATARAMPLSGMGRGGARSRRGSRRAGRKGMRGGFLPALIPIIAAAIGAIPGIAGTAVGIANLAEQKRQFNKMYGDKK